jgi:shikimate kinase/3-dehydroquinate synthase
VKPRPLFLCGLVASGKTTVGKLLAERLGRPFVDLDERIVAETGASVGDLFAQGEAAFRRAEHDALMRLVGEPGAPVVATGGGVVLDALNVRAMQEAGRVLVLDAPIDRLVERLAADDLSARPLLAGLSGPALRARLDELAQARQAAYAAAGERVACGARSPQGVAELVLRMLGAQRQIPVVIPRPDRCEYFITIGRDLTGAVVEQALRLTAGPLLGSPSKPARRVALLSDSTVGPLHGDPLQAALEAAGLQVLRVTVPAGEAAKSLTQLAAVYDALVAGGADRRTPLIAVGGGVVTDLGGFVGATLFRGVPVVHVSTTLVGQVDAAIGGKTAVDTPLGKNLIGAFYQPEAVFCDTRCLETLPSRDLRAGLAEALKTGLIGDPELFETVERAAEKYGSRWPAEKDDAQLEALAHIVERAVAVKVQIVCADEREQLGERYTLNLGHTVGHAIEAASLDPGASDASGSSSVLRHGEAVALGLGAAAHVSVRLGLLPVETGRRIGRVVEALGLSWRWRPWLTGEHSERIRSLLGRDKKREGSHVRFVALKGIGDVTMAPLELGSLWAFLIEGEPAC